MRQKTNIYEVALVIFLLIGSSAAFVAALGYSARGRLFPLIVIALLMIMLALKLFAIFSPKVASRVDIQGIEFPEQKTPSDPDEGLKEQSEDTGAWPKEIMMVFWLVFLLTCIYLAGFLPAVPIFLFLFLKFQGKHSWWVSILTSAAVLAFIYGMFEMVLSVEFPAGVLFSY